MNNNNGYGAGGFDAFVDGLSLGGGRKNETPAAPQNQIRGTVEGILSGDGFILQSEHRRAGGI